MDSAAQLPSAFVPHFTLCLMYKKRVLMLLHTENRKRYAALWLQEITSEPMTQVSGGMHSKFCTSEAHVQGRATGCSMDTHVRTRGEFLSLPPLIKVRIMPSTTMCRCFCLPRRQLTHMRAHWTKSQKSVKLPPDDNVRTEIFLPSTHPA